MIIKKNIRKRKGFSLLELMLVLAIVAGLTAGAFITYSKVSDNYRINTAVKQIITLRTVVQQAYASKGNYEGLSTDVVSDQITDDLKKDSSGSYRNIYNLPYGLSASWMTASKSANSGFYISYYVKKEDCFSIVKRLYTAGFTYILINSSTAIDTINNKSSDDSTLYTYCTSQSGNTYANLQLYAY